MRNVLFLAYHFPPIGGAGAQRPARLVRHLPELGYRPIVLTGPGAPPGRWTPEDEALAADVPADVEVVRVPGPDPGASTGVRRIAERWLGVPSSWRRWWIGGASGLGEAVGERAELVYAWMQPYASAEAAAAIARSLGKPWVADLGDPWALDEMMVYPTALHRRLDLRRMGRLLGSASAIVMSTPEAARRVRELTELDGRPVVSIPNGFDARDFESPPPERRDGAFRIVHTGYLYTALGRRHRRTVRLRRLLGGGVAAVDILPRSHVYLLEAVRLLLEEEPSLRDRIEVHLAGVMSDVDREVAAGCDVVRAHGYVAHDEAVRLVRAADLLFLPMHDLPPGTRATIVPGKTYEYLASGRPILAAVPDGDARDLLSRAPNVEICRPTDVAGMLAAIRRQIDRARAGDPLPGLPADALGRYEYRRHAASLARVFDDVLEGAGA